MGNDAENIHVGVGLDVKPGTFETDRKVAYETAWGTTISNFLKTPRQRIYKRNDNTDLCDDFKRSYKTA